jgi:plastocyanin
MFSAMKLQGMLLRSLCSTSVAILVAMPVFGAVHTVDVMQNSFSPATLEISVGDSVRWVNRFDMFHTTTSSAPIPLWRALLLDEEDEFTFHSIRPEPFRIVVSSTPA